MLVQEPVQAAIWHCLNHYAYNDAIFLAERLRAEVESDETIWLLATCYYRSGKPAQAYSILKNGSSPQCKFLLAKCCLDLQKLSEAEAVLMGGDVGRSRNMDEMGKEFGDMAGFALMLVASVCFSTERHHKGIEATRKALKLNPFLWTSFEELCKRGDRPDPAKSFTVPPLEALNNVTGVNPVISYINRTDISSTPNMQTIRNNSISTPIQIVNVSNGCMSGVRAFTPEVTPLPLPSAARPKRAIRYKNTFTGSLSPLTPSFGVIPLDLSSSGGEGFVSPINTLTEANDQKAITKRRKVNVFQQLLNRKEGGGPSLPPPPPPPHLSQMFATPTQPPALQQNVRRSSRLFTSNYNNVKENSTKSPNRNKSATPKSPSRKSKGRVGSGVGGGGGVGVKGGKGSSLLGGEVNNEKSNNNINNNNNNNSSKSASEGGDMTLSLSHPIETHTTPKTLTEQALQLQKESLEGLMALLRELGTAYLYLSQFECKKAIDCLQSLPPHHQNTGWVLSLLGKAYFELNDYKQSVRVLSEVRGREPERTGMMEILSTALWHLQKEAALSSLAQDLVSLDRDSPQAWCAAGNCFSLQKEHDTAIKFFQRAVQVDPNFAYAYTLLGHEYVVTEELDKGMSAFRNAVRLDSRHYNAWYGIGTIYSKQEKFQLAELHYKRALSINPHSCVLMCHIGVVQLALQRKEEALETLNRAIALEPGNPLCKFHRASILTSIGRHLDALAELEQLKEIVPKESLVYYLTGKVHKKLGNTHLALMHFSWATDLDPKGATTQIKEAIDPAMSHSHSDDLGEDSTTEEVVGGAAETTGRGDEEEDSPFEVVAETDEES